MSTQTQAADIIVVEGWQLDVRDADEPRIRDVDLAERLGYERPRKLRDIIRRYEKSGDLSGVHVRPTVGRTSMPHGGERQVTVDEYWLTEADALFIVAKSETAEAKALTREMIRVFRLAMRRQLPGQQLGPDPATERRLAALEKTMGDIAALLKQSLEQQHRPALPQLYEPGVGKAAADVLKRQLTEYGELMHRADPSRSAKSHRTHGDVELRALLGWGGLGRTWSLLPLGRRDDLAVAIEAMLQRARRLAAGKPDPRQRTLADLEPAMAAVLPDHHTLSTPCRPRLAGRRHLEPPCPFQTTSSGF